jgi:arylsulfatase A-like enzyme
MSNLAATSAVAGRPVHMPTLKDLANDGLKYNEFHNTALGPPTGITLLTGRNERMNNIGGITEVATRFPETKWAPRSNVGARQPGIRPCS